jgi:hypothetical protein
MSVPLAPSPMPDQASRREAPGQVALDGAAELGQCTRCGAVSTHYLTCPSLRLPEGYRVSAEREYGLLR